MTYRVGIIGCGRMACTIDDEVVGKLDKSGMLLPYCHAGGYLDYPETEMVAACDIDPERLRNAQERWHIPRGYTDFRELYPPRSSPTSSASPPGPKTTPRSSSSLPSTASRGCLSRSHSAAR